MSHTVPSMSWSHSGLEGSRKGKETGVKYLSLIRQKAFFARNICQHPWDSALNLLQLGRPLWMALKRLWAPDQKKHEHLATGSSRNSTIIGGFSWEKSENCLSVIGTTLSWVETGNVAQWGARGFVTEGTRFEFHGGYLLSVSPWVYS